MLLGSLCRPKASAKPSILTLFKFAQNLYIKLEKMCFTKISKINTHAGKKCLKFFRKGLCLWVPSRLISKSGFEVPTTRLQ